MTSSNLISSMVLNNNNYVLNHASKSYLFSSAEKYKLNRNIHGVSTTKHKGKTRPTADNISALLLRLLQLEMDFTQKWLEIAYFGREITNIKHY